MDEINKKDCFNCKYFLRYYVNHNGYYSYIHKGHCINRALTIRESAKRVEKNLQCEYWQPRELQKEETKEKICDTLRFIAQQVNEITQILKEED